MLGTFNDFLLEPFDDKYSKSLPHAQPFLTQEKNLRDHVTPPQLEHLRALKPRSHSELAEPGQVPSIFISMIAVSVWRSVSVTAFLDSMRLPSGPHIGAS